MIQFLRGMFPSLWDCLSTAGWVFQQAKKKNKQHTSGTQYPVYQQHYVFINTAICSSEVFMPPPPPLQRVLVSPLPYMHVFYSWNMLTKDLLRNNGKIINTGLFIFLHLCDQLVVFDFLYAFNNEEALLNSDSGIWDNKHCELWSRHIRHHKMIHQILTYHMMNCHALAWVHCVFHQIKSWW